MFLLPPNILSGQATVPPDGVFLLPVCTTREALSEIIHALDYYYRFHKTDYLAVKDVYNAALHINDPSWQCWIDPLSPEQPELTGAQQTDSSGCSCGCGSDIGMLGLSTHQLEDILMSSIQDVRCINGVIQVIRFGCCTWEDLCSIGGVSVGQPSSGDITIQQWDGDGQPALPSFGQAIITNPDLTGSADGIRCVKAAALATFLRNQVGFALEVIDAAQLSGITLDVVALAAAAYFLSPLVALPAFAGIAIGAYLRQNELEDLEILATAIYNAGATWSQYECELVTILEYGDEITTEDFYRALTFFASSFDIAGSGDDENAIIEFIKLFPMSWTMTNVVTLSETVDCNCDDYIPLSSQSLPTGSLQILRAGKAQVVSPGSPNGSFIDYHGNADPDAPYAVEQGSFYGEQYYASQNLGDGNGTNNGGAIVYVFSQEVTITGIRWIYEVSQHNSSSQTNLKSYLYRESTSEWRATQDDQQVRNIGLHLYEEAITAVTPVSRAVLQFRNRAGSGNHSLGKLVEVVFTGTLGGQAFSLRPGEVFTPA